MDYNKKFDFFFFQSDVNPLKGSEKGGGEIRLILIKYHSDCYMENGGSGTRWNARK